LRHRREILDWAGIDRQVTKATDELLASLLEPIRERLLAVDVAAQTVRHNGGTYRGETYQRILARHESWPEGLGVALEWIESVDPFGSHLIKFGIFSNPARTEINAFFPQLATAFSEAGYVARGFKVPEGRSWVITRYLPKSDDWWQRLEEWQEDLIGLFTDLFPVAAPIVDGVLISVGRPVNDPP
jgi:hypothetical protein